VEIFHLVLLSSKQRFDQISLLGKYLYSTQHDCRDITGTYVEKGFNFSIISQSFLSKTQSTNKHKTNSLPYNPTKQIIIMKYFAPLALLAVFFAGAEAGKSDSNDLGM